VPWRSIGFYALTGQSVTPTLNAIEPLWKDLKGEISPTIFEGKDHFNEFVSETFLRLSHRLRFAVDWIETFLPNNIQRLQ
jgi:hypothetical protein